MADSMMAGAVKGAMGELVLERVIDAPREILFDAWTDPVHIVEWWGLEGFTYSIKEMNVRPGGAWRFVMRGPDGTDYPFNAVYKEVSRPGRLVFEYVNAEGSVFFKQTVLFEETGDKTKVSIYLLFPSEAKDTKVKKNGAIEGLKHTLGRLEKYVEKEGGSDLVISRVFDAPKALVWKEWSDPKRMMQWWGPAGYSAPVIKSDFRAGGKYLWAMRSPDGRDAWNAGEFKEIVPMKRIVYSQYFSDDRGSMVPASSYGVPGDWAPDAVVTATVSFEDVGEKTKMTIRQTGMPRGAIVLARAGWSSSLDKMADDIMPTKNFSFTVEGQGVLVRSVFDAPRDLVWKACNDPEMIPKWWGPENINTEVETMETRPGGIWRFVQSNDQGLVFAFHGVYHEVSVRVRVVRTTEFEGVPGHAALETASFAERDGKTILTQRTVFQSTADRDGMIATEMERGVRESMERLRKLLAKMS